MRATQRAIRRSAARSTSTICLDAGTLHLHDHVREADVGGDRGGEPRAMGLTEGCGGDRHRLERGVRLLQRHPEFPSVCVLMRVERLGRDLVLQPLELAGDLRGQDVEARREELPDLDHQAAEIGGEHAEPSREIVEPFRATVRGELPQADARQHELVPPGLRQEDRGEADDSPAIRTRTSSHSTHGSKPALPSGACISAIAAPNSPPACPAMRRARACAAMSSTMPRSWPSPIRRSPSVRDANGGEVAETGSRRGHVTGTFFHLIAEER